MSFKNFLKENLPEPALDMLKAVRDGMKDSLVGSVLMMHAYNALEGTRHRFSIRDKEFLVSYEIFGEKICVSYPYEHGVFPVQSSFEVNSYLQIPDFIRKGDIVIDAGAWPGDFTIVASRLVGESGKVIALEPNPDSIGYLRNVIHANGVRNVETLELGLYSSETTLNFIKNSYGSKIADSEKDQEFTSISTTTIDNLLEDIGKEKRIIVKMDIEGAEIEAIKGASESMKNRDIGFAIASYHLIGGQKSMYLLEPMFKEKGFSVEHLYPRHLTSYAKKA